MIRFLLLFLSFVLVIAKEGRGQEVPSKDFGEAQELVASYLKDLEELGYCVIPKVFSDEETTTLYTRVWSEFIEKAWSNCTMQDRSNWKDSFPIHNKMGIFSGPAGQTQVMWDLRTCLKSL
ncbi:MAG: hypothetical protein AAGI90_02605 [Chlamydiota bacterium]